MLLKGALYSPASAHFLPADNVMNEKKQTSQKKKKKPLKIQLCAQACVCVSSRATDIEKRSITLYMER